jgi:hypothetical protein
MDGQEAIVILPGEERSLVLQSSGSLGRWKLRGVPGKTYELNRSTNLSQWLPVQRVVADGTGTAEFTDERVLTDTSGYFMAREMP